MYRKWADDWAGEKRNGAMAAQVKAKRAAATKKAKEAEEAKAAAEAKAASEVK